MYCGDPTRIPVLVSAVASTAPRDPEVDHPRPVPGQQHIRRLQVPVHHPGTMNRGQRLGHPGHQQEHALGRHRPVIGHRPRQGRPGHVRRHQPRRRPVRITVKNLRREQTVHASRGRDLLPEPNPEVRVVAQLRPHHLERHRPAARGKGQVHPAYPAGPQPSPQPVARHLGRVAGSQRLWRQRAHLPPHAVTGRRR
jgi:hypothetical protein